jgi:hypothetical protein
LEREGFRNDEKWFLEACIIWEKRRKIPAVPVRYGGNLLISRNEGFLPGWKCGAETFCSLPLEE